MAGPARAVGQGLLPRRPQRALVGHRGLHRGHRDEHPDLHRRPGHRLQRQLDVPAARARLRHRPLRHRRRCSSPRTSAASCTRPTSCCSAASAARCAGRPPAIFLLYRTLGDGIRLHAAALVLSVAASVPEWWCIVAPRRGDDRVHRGGRRHRHHLDRHHPDVRVPGRRARLPGRGGAAVAGRRLGRPGRGAGGGQDAGPRLLPRPREALHACGRASIGGAFLTLATHGTDHYLVQRLLVAKSQRDAADRASPCPASWSSRSSSCSWCWARCSGRITAAGPSRAATRSCRPSSPPSCRARWSGFILAAVVAAALSPSLNSMASATVRDFYLPYFRPDASDARADARGAALHRRLGRRCRWAWRWPRRGRPPRSRTAWRP